MGSDSKERLAALDIDSVVKDIAKFKAGLAIEDDKLTASDKFSFVEGIAGAAAAGGAVASSSIVATTLFPAKGVLAALGLATAATPVGWIVLSAAVSGVGYMAVRRHLQKQSVSADKAPKFIKSSLDRFAVEMFALLAPLLLRIAGADGEFHALEMQKVRRHFTRSWGYDPAFVDLGLECILEDLDGLKTEDVAMEFSQLCKSVPECEYQKVAGKLVGVLEDIMAADGQVCESEERELAKIRQIFDKFGDERK